MSALIIELPSLGMSPLIFFSKIFSAIWKSSSSRSQKSMSSPDTMIFKKILKVPKLLNLYRDFWPRDSCYDSKKSLKWLPKSFYNELFYIFWNFATYAFHVTNKFFFEQSFSGILKATQIHCWIAQIVQFIVTLLATFF